LAAGRIKNQKIIFEKNMPGAMIHKGLLKMPYEPYKSKRQSAQLQSDSCPPRDDLDMTYQSFKPGMTSEQRFKQQDMTTFYSSQYSQSGF
jgi:hypothetical protein